MKNRIFVDFKFVEEKHDSFSQKAKLKQIKPRPRSRHITSLQESLNSTVTADTEYQDSLNQSDEDSKLKYSSHIDYCNYDEKSKQSLLDEDLSMKESSNHLHEELNKSNENIFDIRDIEPMETLMKGDYLLSNGIKIMRIKNKNS